MRARLGQRCSDLSELLLLARNICLSILSRRSNSFFSTMGALMEKETLLRGRYELYQVYQVKIFEYMDEFCIMGIDDGLILVIFRGKLGHQDLAQFTHIGGFDFAQNVHFFFGKLKAKLLNGF